jgi:hypothetical protein
VVGNPSKTNENLSLKLDPSDQAAVSPLARFPMTARELCYWPICPPKLGERGDYDLILPGGLSINTGDFETILNSIMSILRHIGEHITVPY